MRIESLWSLLHYFFRTNVDLIIGMITDIIIHRWHMSAQHATSESLLMASYKEALMVNVLILWLQYFTVCAKRHSEGNRREFARIREEDARARRRNTRRKRLQTWAGLNLYTYTERFLDNAFAKHWYNPLVSACIHPEPAMLFFC